MSDKKLLDSFGQEFISSIRDQSIFEFEAILNGRMKSKSSIELSNEIKAFDENQINVLKKVVFNSIDSVIYNVLNMLEQNEENMKLLISQDGNDEKNILELSDGLSGELFTENGWIEKFSKYEQMLYVGLGKFISPSYFLNNNYILPLTQLSIFLCLCRDFCPYSVRLQRLSACFQEQLRDKVCFVEPPPVVAPQNASLSAGQGAALTPARTKKPGKIYTLSQLVFI